MSTYDVRLAALEKDVTVMKQDIIYKLDDTNSAVTVIQGIVGVQGRDLKYLISQVKVIDARLAKSELQLEGLTQEVGTIKEQQEVQGQDIKDIKGRLDGIDQRLGGIDQRLDGIDQRLDGIDHRFTSLEKKFDQRFEQVLQVLATLTNKP